MVLNCAHRAQPATNTQGQPAQRVRAKSVKVIGNLDFPNTVSFSLNSAVPIPDDASLVIFAQHHPAFFGNNAIIYGGIEVELDR